MYLEKRRMGTDLECATKKKSMGTAWQKSSSYPWETTRYVSGIEVIKVNITLRIYSAKWHVYAGLAMLNPSAKSQIQQYASSATELFKLMVEGRGEELEDRIWRAREEVFGWRRGEEAGEGDKARAPILLGEDVLDQFSLGKKTTEMQSKESPNSHLSLLAMVDCWAKLGIRPYEHLDVAGTPVFMLWIGMSIFLFIALAKDMPNRYRCRRVPFPLASTPFCRSWRRSVRPGPPS